MSRHFELPIETRLIETRERLGEACEQWRRLPEIGIDTEFVRERTFYPALGLIQVADGTASYLVDTEAIDDLEPLAKILRDAAVTKVFHSCGEDLEVLYHRFGSFPRTVFDTQVAAALTGKGVSMGYGRMVSALFAVELPKDKTRTNWLRRPLSEAQKTYAALDVAYLIPARRRLNDELRRLGREDWLLEELEALPDAERFLPDPEGAYRRLRGWRALAPRQLALLRELAAWRELQARRRNLPRNFVLREKALLEVARRMPKAMPALRTLASLSPRDIQRHGRMLLRLIDKAAELPRDQLPERQRSLDLTPYRQVIRRLRKAVSEVADDLDLPPELLANRRTVEATVRGAVSGRERTLPRRLTGWRRQIIGERMVEILEAELDMLNWKQDAAPSQT